MFKRHVVRRLKSVPLSQKISLPFLLIFLGIWTVGTVILGEYFSITLEARKQRKAADLASLVELDIQRELEDLQKSARLLSLKTEIVDAAEERNQLRLQQQILPLKGILEADYIRVLSRQNQTLLDSRIAPLLHLTLDNETVTNLLLSGSDVSTVISAPSPGPPILLGGAPLKSDQGVIGGIELGIALNNDLLSQIDSAIDGYLVALSIPHPSQNTATAHSSSKTSVEVIAASDALNPSWIQTLSQDFYDGNEPHDDAHNHPDFMAQHVYVEGLAEQHIELLLVIPKGALIQAKQTLWVFLFAIAGVGCTITTVLSAWIGHRLARPILDLTDIAQQVVQEENFNLRAKIKCRDEVGLLARAFNQLVHWIGEYTQELEQAAHTLEDRVEERTQELSTALTELRDTQSQLIQTEKMSSLGQMVAGIAHEINNPISFIQGNLPPLQEYFEDLLALVAVYREEYPSPTEAVLEKQEDIELDFLLEDTVKILGSVKMGTERVSNIVISLRNYSRLDEATIKDVDIHDGINSTLLILNHRIKQGVEVVKDYGNLPTVRCSPSQLNQVFTNIIANALDAMIDKDSHPQAFSPQRLTIITRMLSNHQVQVRFRDTGPGMTSEIKEKIFDPFFTTKGVGQGTGLGMGICFKIIEQHQGSIAVETEVGEGTEFILTLPVDSPTLATKTLTPA